MIVYQDPIADGLNRLLDWRGTHIDIDIEIHDVDLAALQNEEARLISEWRGGPGLTDAVAKETAHLRERLLLPIKRSIRTSATVTITSSNRPIYDSIGFSHYHRGIPDAHVKLCYEVSR